MEIQTVHKTKVKNLLKELRTLYSVWVVLSSWMHSRNLRLRIACWMCLTAMTLYAGLLLSPTLVWPSWKSTPRPAFISPPCDPIQVHLGLCHLPTSLSTVVTLFTQHRSPIRECYFSSLPGWTEGGMLYSGLSTTRWTRSPWACGSPSIVKRICMEPLIDTSCRSTLILTVSVGPFGQKEPSTSKESISIDSYSPTRHQLNLKIKGQSDVLTIYLNISFQRGI